jgi:hypothetical protein
MSNTDYRALSIDASIATVQQPGAKGSSSLAARKEKRSQEYNMSQHFKIRTYHRAAIYADGHYLSEDFLGKAVVKDICLGGWRIQGDHKVSVGQKLALRLDVPGQVLSIDVEKATVQWVRGCDFGIRINKISTSNATLLAHLVSICRQEVCATKH